jgi:hypothetical protein
MQKVEKKYLDLGLLNNLLVSKFGNDVEVHPYI